MEVNNKHHVNKICIFPRTTVGRDIGQKRTFDLVCRFRYWCAELAVELERDIHCGRIRLRIAHSDLFECRLENDLCHHAMSHVAAVFTLAITQSCLNSNKNNFSPIRSTVTTLFVKYVNLTKVCYRSALDDTIHHDDMMFGVSAADRPSQTRECAHRLRPSRISAVKRRNRSDLRSQMSCRNSCMRDDIHHRSESSQLHIQLGIVQFKLSLLMRKTIIHTYLRALLPTVSWCYRSDRIAAIWAIANVFRRRAQLVLRSSHWPFCGVTRRF